uniref:Uncharacterized protein n=1 Tax=Romanomermis culicivorax TaxID=13658 RepID=A0A915J8I5_ROMCU
MINGASWERMFDRSRFWIESLETSIRSLRIAFHWGRRQSTKLVSGDYRTKQGRYNRSTGGKSEYF